jgi:hypothetical protein
MVPKSRTRVVEPAAPRAPGRTLPPAPANKDKTSWPGMLLRPRYSLPPETKWQRPCKRLSRSMGRYDGTAMWNFGELFAAMRPARTLKFADGTRPSQSPHAGRAELQANRASRMICRSENRSSPIPHRRELSPDRCELARQPLHVVALSGDMSPNRRHGQIRSVRGWRCRYDLQKGTFDVPPEFKEHNAKAVGPDSE